jgi:Xaa-Pro aminopeptidase
LVAGDPVFVIEGVSCNGYWANLARTVFVGKAAPNDQRPQALAVVESALHTVCAKLAPGATLQGAVDGVDRALAEANLAGRRVYPMFRGLGLSKAERPNLGDLTTPLQPGMCFCAQLYVRLGRAIVGLSDSVLITERSAELLTTT